MRKLGNEFSSDELNKAAEDFQKAADCATELISHLDEMGVDRGAALGGALTCLIAHLIASSPDTPTAMGMLSSCIGNAAFEAYEFEVNYHPGTTSLQ